MLLGLMLVLTVLILLFQSVIQPFTILFSLPLAIGGVAAALILTNTAVSMPVLIGILMLMGIVTKNAILLVDFAIEMRARGMDRAARGDRGRPQARAAHRDDLHRHVGGHAALGAWRGRRRGFRAPMAIAVIGGIIVSTVLSLVVVPSFYLIMDDLQRLLAWIFGGLVGKKEEEPEAPSTTVLADDIGTLAARVDALEAGRPAPVGALRAAE